MAQPMKAPGKVKSRLGAVVLLGITLLGITVTGCRTSNETIAPEAGKPPSATEKADEAKRAASGKM